LWFRVVLHIALWSLFALGPATRVTYWLAVGTIVEAWPWQLWGEPYVEFANSMLGEKLTSTYVFVMAAGFAAIGLLLRSPPRPDPLWRRALLATPRTVYLGMLAACLLALFPYLLINSVRVVRNFPPRTDHLLKENCGHCHSPHRPQHYIRSREMWARTVHRMIERNGAPVSESDAEQIIRWLGDYRAFSDGWMFRAKCERCHHRTHLLETPRTAEEWEWIIQRMSWLNTFAYRADQTEQLRRYTAEHLSEPAPREETPEHAAWVSRLELQRSCNPCHSISLILEDGALDDTRAMVERMSRKNPDLVPPDRIEALTEALDELPRERTALGEMFPHDQLLELQR